MAEVINDDLPSLGMSNLIVAICIHKVSVLRDANCLWVAKQFLILICTAGFTLHKFYTISATP